MAVACDGAHAMLRAAPSTVDRRRACSARSMIAAAVLGAWRSVVRTAHSLAGARAPRPSADRQVLEAQILPWLAARADVHRILFVGCARYTRDYGRCFARQEYWTIDPVARRRRWGAERHIVGRFEDLGRHAPPATFDAIVCNGVLGWGLDRRADAEAAFAASHAALRPLGELIVGWNDVAPHDRVRPESLASLARFERLPLPGHTEFELRIAGARRHVYLRYRRGA
jgi:SAM-dependent methyltransferase